jgi:hypothetical protein
MQVNIAYARPLVHTKIVLRHTNVVKLITGLDLRYNIFVGLIGSAMAPPRKPKPERTTAELSPAASEAASKVARELRMKKKDYIEQLLIWMARDGQPKTLKLAAIDHLVPGHEIQILELVLKGLRERAKRPGSYVEIEGSSATRHEIPSAPQTESKAGA